MLLVWGPHFEKHQAGIFNLIEKTRKQTNKRQLPLTFTNASQNGAPVSSCLSEPHFLKTLSNLLISVFSPHVRSDAMETSLGKLTGGFHIARFQGCFCDLFSLSTTWRLVKCFSSSVSFQDIMFFDAFPPDSPIASYSVSAHLPLPNSRCQSALGLGSRPSSLSPSLSGQSIIPSAMVLCITACTFLPISQDGSPEL